MFQFEAFVTTESCVFCTVYGITSSSNLRFSAGEEFNWYYPTFKPLMDAQFSGITLLRSHESLSASKTHFSSRHNMREQAKCKLQLEERMSRRILLTFLAATLTLVPPSFGKTKKQNPYDERRLLEQNKRIQRENNAPDDFPNFVREGFTVKIVASDNYVTRDSGLVLWDIAIGNGDSPKPGQQVTFHYIGYNESGRRIDSTYFQGSPAKVRLGTNALIPGFEEGIKDMKPGGKRRLIVPPELGPPVGPSTFFSSKQYEVFDVELLSIQDCTRRTIGFYSDVVCG